MGTDAGMIVNYVLSMLLKKITVPADFQNQCIAIKEMLSDDITGLVDSLTDFAVESASVNYRIQTENKNLTELLEEWLQSVNVKFNGMIPPGINSLAKQYFEERWKGGSFPVLMIDKWNADNGLLLPSQMHFVDGGSIHAIDVHKDNKELTINNYDYYITSKIDSDHKIKDNCIIARPYGKWFEKYPVPFLIKRGVYHNYLLIKSLKDQESKILDQIIPYLLLIKKGSEGLALNDKKVYSQPELDGIVQQFQALMDYVKSSNLTDKAIKAPMRVTNFDEEIKHLIPDLQTIFASTLFEVADRNILTGLGFIDVAEAVSNSRKESVLNPKVFITDVKQAVEDFKNHILIPLVFKIKDKNEENKKYINKKFYITSSPVKAFLTDGFKDRIRQAYDRGTISKKTFTELVGEVSFENEVYQRKEETKQGLDETLYPPIIDNREGAGLDVQGQEPINKIGKNGKEIPPSKQGIEKKIYNIGAIEETEIPEKIEEQEANPEDARLEGAPYQNIKDLPPEVKKLSKPKQKAWLKIFNNAYNYKLKETKDTKKAEEYAFAVAWSKIKLVKANQKVEEEE